MHRCVCVFPVRAGGEILLQLRDDRPGLVNRNLWATLGGGIESGETPAAAAWREIEEEVGRRPPGLITAGFVDGPSPSRPGEMLRMHLFGAAVAWPLDALILAEGQCVDWFAPAEALALPIAPPIEVALEAFLSSEHYPRLRAVAPLSRHAAQASLPKGLMQMLGLRRGALLALRGANAGFVHGLWEQRDGVRLTTSPAEHERPDALVWWPRDEPLEPVLQGWRSRLAPSGTIWVALPDGDDSDAGLARLRAAGGSTGFAIGGPIALGDGQHAVRFAPALHSEAGTL